jgi:hypothetical protein
MHGGVVDYQKTLALVLAVAGVLTFLWKVAFPVGVLLLDSLWRRTWERNLEFVEKRILDALTPQLEQLATLPRLAISVEMIARSIQRQTRNISRMTKTQSRHGKAIASIQTAIEFMRDEPHPLRRRNARRIGDPEPDDLDLEPEDDVERPIVLRGDHPPDDDDDDGHGD